MKYSIFLLSFIFISGCDDSGCHDSVKLLTPNTTASASINEQVCSHGAKLKVTDKDQSLVALCRCPDAVPDAGALEEKK